MVLHTIPELRRLPRDRRRALLRQALPPRDRLLLAGVVGLAVLAACGLGAAAMPVLAATRQPALILAGGALFAGAACLAVHQLTVRLTRQAVRAWVKTHCRDRRLGLCLDCGYDQRGHRRADCPECGAPLHFPGRFRRAA